MDDKYIIALELSGSQVKGAAAFLPNSPYAQLSKPTIDAIAFEDKVNCVQYGRVINLIEAAKQTGYVLQKLENNPKLKGGKVASVYVALSGRSLGSMPATAELTLPTEMEITDEIVMQLQREATKTVPEDKKVLKVLPRKFVVDNQVNPNPVGSLGSKLKGEFTIVTCNPANRKNLELVIADRMKLQINDFIVTPLAIADMVLGEEEKQLGCALVDIGAQTTTVSIYKDSALQYLATLPLGSRNITRDIVIGLNATEERAELLKCTQGDALLDPTAAPNDDKNTINCYVNARAGEIIANIVAQLGYAGFKSSDLVGGFILTGRGAKLKNFAQLLESQSSMKVRHASIPATISITDRSISPSDFTSIISIVLNVSRRDDVANCIVMPEPEVKEEVDNSDSFSESEGPDDNNWAVDDEEIDQKRRKAIQNEERKREKERKKEEELRRAEEKKREKEEQRREKEELKRRKEEERRSRPSFLANIRDKMERILNYDPEIDDTNIEEN